MVIPKQADPDFINPISHMHRYAPSVLLHEECSGQKYVSISEHSFTSSEQSSPCQPGLHVQAPFSGLHTSVFPSSHVQFSLQLSPYRPCLHAEIADRILYMSHGCLF